MAKIRKKPAIDLTNAAATRGELMVYGPIESYAMEGAITAEQFALDLAAITADEVEVRISSPGGNIVQGLAMMAAVDRHPARTIGTVEGMALSIAGVLLQAFDVRRMHQNSFLMVHGAYGYAEGEVQDLKRAADRLEKMQAQIAGIFERRTGQSAETVAQWLAGETWFTADEALAAGLIDEIIATDVAMAAHFDLSGFSVPDRFRDLVGATNKLKEVNQMADTQTPVTPAAPAPATAQELKERFTDASADFILSQLVAGNDINKATLEYCKAMENQLKEARAEAAKRAAEPVVQLTGAVNAINAGVQQHGVAPSTGATTTPATSDPNDNRNAYEDYLRANRGKMSPAALLRNAMAKFPRGYAELRNEHEEVYRASQQQRRIRPTV